MEAVTPCPGSAVSSYPSKDVGSMDLRVSACSHCASAASQQFQNILGDLRLEDLWSALQGGVLGSSNTTRTTHTFVTFLGKWGKR